jgi:hypothetical protein
VGYTAESHQGPLWPLLFAQSQAVTHGNFLLQPGVTSPSEGIARSGQWSSFVQVTGVGVFVPHAALLKRPTLS